MKAIIIILGIALIIFGAWMLVPRQETPADTPPVDEVDRETETTANVFFYKQSEDMDEEGNALCSPEAVLPVERRVTIEVFEDDPVQTILDVLLAGPMEDEREEGFSSEFPLDGFEVRDLEVSGGIATITFSDPEKASVGGSCRVTLLRTQIEKTVRNLDGIEEVEILPETIFQP